MNLVTILKRDQPNNRLDFECPSCHKLLQLGPVSLTEISSGHRVVSWCSRCQTNTPVSLASLGGFLWSQSKAC